MQSLERHLNMQGKSAFRLKSQKYTFLLNEELSSLSKNV